MVEQVQAIDNYSANPLLKGIEEGGKVSLNLKLKKGKFDLSGNVDAGIGIADAGKEAIRWHSTLLGISQNYKSFGSLSYNNIGVNESPFDHFGGNIGVERTKEKDYYALKVIPESAFSTPLEDMRANVNQQWFANHNITFKVGKKKRLSVKNNLFFLKDNISAYQLSQNINAIDGQTFITTDERNTYKKPIQYRGDIEMKYNTSKTSLLEYNFRISQENIQTPILTRMNETDNFASDLQSKDFYLKQNLLFTKKIGSKSLFKN